MNQFADMTEEEFLEVYGKGLHEGRKVTLGTKAWDDGAEYDENGRFVDRHDEDMHNYFDYNDYAYIDDTLKTCGSSIDWVKKGKVGKPKQQSTCGSCWAHSTIASVETLHAILTNVSH